MELLPQALMDGIMLGAIYIIIAVAFSLVYGVMHVIDFAVGEWIMLGAFVGFYLTEWTHVEPILLLLGCSSSSRRSATCSSL
jgi:branched-chain amino acid transport system permease protein